MSLFIVLVVVVSFAVALVRRAPLEEVATRSFAWWGLLAAGFGLTVVAHLRAFTWLTSAPVPLVHLPLGAPIYLASFLFLIVFLARNLDCPGFSALVAGLVLNFAVIALNGGQMPGEPSQLAAAGLLTPTLADQAAGHWTPYGLVGPSTSLAWFADRIFLPLPWHAPIVISIGDLFVALGCFLVFNNPFRVPYRFSIRRRYGAL